MAVAGAFHSGALRLLLHRRNPSPPWSYVRSHLLSSKPSRPPPNPSASSRFASTPPPLFATSIAPARRRGGAGVGVRFVGWYLGSLEARPVLTKSLTAASIFTAADLSSQMITLGPKDSLDLIRTLRMASYGLLISGPSLHLWFNFVSKILPKKDVLNTFKKMFIGQAVYGPIINSVFFSYNAALQGETVPEIVARLKRDLIPTIKSGLLYWPLCDFITFKFIPVRLQPLVSNSFSFLWTIYITYMASLKKADVEVVTRS